MSQSHCVLSFTPKKAEILPLHLALPLSPPHHLSPPPLGFDPPLDPHGKDDRARKESGEREGARRKRDDSSSTSVAHRDRESERGKKRRVNSDDELLTMGEGGDICSIKRLWSWVKHARAHCSLFTHIHWVNSLGLPSYLIINSL